MFSGTRLLVSIILSISGAFLVSGSVEAHELQSALDRPNCETCLGPIVRLHNTDSPIDGFKRESVNLASLGRTELFLITANQRPTSPGDAEEMWPIVKALKQFGSLSRVGVWDKLCSQQPTPSGSQVEGCSPPTFDLSRATYRSRYIRFSVSYEKLAGHYSLKQMRDGLGKVRLGTSATALERKLFDKYICHAAGRTCGTPPSSAPIIGIGRDLQTRSYFISPSDFEAPGPPPPNNATPGPDLGASGRIYSFSVVHQALVTSHDPSPGVPLVEDVNEEANVFIALLCSQDGGKPANVCGKSVIRTIIKAAK